MGSLSVWTDGFQSLGREVIFRRGQDGREQIELEEGGRFISQVERKGSDIINSLLVTLVVLPGILFAQLQPRIHPSPNFILLSGQLVVKLVQLDVQRSSNRHGTPSSFTFDHVLRSILHLPFLPLLLLLFIGNQTSSRHSSSFLSRRL